MTFGDTLPMMPASASGRTDLLLVNLPAPLRERIASLLRPHVGRILTLEGLEQLPRSLRGDAEALVVGALHRVDKEALAGLRVVRERHPGLALLLVGRPLSAGHAIEVLEQGVGGIVLDAEDEAELLAQAHRCVRKAAVAAAGARRLADELDRVRIIQSDERAFDHILTLMHLLYRPVVHGGSGDIVAYEVVARVDEAACPDQQLAAMARARTRELDFQDRFAEVVAEELENRAYWQDLFVPLDTHRLVRGALGGPQDPLWPFASRLVLQSGANLGDGSDAHLQEAVDRARRAGYRFALLAPCLTREGLRSRRILAAEFLCVDERSIGRGQAARRSAPILRALVETAHAEGAKVMARELQDPAALAVAQDCGCDLLQGDALGGPRAEPA